MDMKVKAIYVAAAAFVLLAAGCKKGSFTEGSAPVFGEGGQLQFAVSASGFTSTRSHFADESQGSLGDQIALVWDDDDAIGIVAIPYDETLGKYRFDLVADEAHVCIATYSGVDANGKALFTSTEDNPTWWMVKGENAGDDYTADDCLYGIFAYYPATEKHPFKLYGEDIDVGFVGDYHIDKLYSPTFHLDAEQDGVNFNDHHILYDLTHLPMLDIENKKSSFLTAATLKSGERIDLPGFEPVTTMLRFKLASADGETHSIAKVRATVRRYRGGDKEGASYWTGTVWQYLEYNYCTYYLPFFGIAGDSINPTAFHPGVQEQFYNYMEGDTKGDDEDDEEWYLMQNYKHIMATALVTGESDLMPPFTGFYCAGIHSSNSVTVTFASPVEVSSTPSASYYMVLYPTFLQMFESGINGLILFEALDSEGNVVLSGEKYLPVNGLEAGHRYNFTLTLGNGVSYDGSTAGSYDYVDVGTL